ncbi:MAG: 30S ribosomal protein S6 [Deltaproteobacteria bacterium]|nr:30S ribosomal protein S6 [Deltaproteobacteria bacterium]
MREYETTFIVQPEISDEGIAALCARLDGVLEKGSATRLLWDDMGRRRLAYEIRSFQKGRYMTLMYLDEGTMVPEIERTLRLDDSVLRFLTVQVQEEVEDVDARKAEAAELERVRAEKAAERAARDAEDAARLAAEEAERAAAAEARLAEAAAEAAAAAPEEAAAAAPEEASAAAPEEASAAAPKEAAAAAPKEAASGEGAPAASDEGGGTEAVAEEDKK